VFWGFLDEDEREKRGAGGVTVFFAAGGGDGLQQQEREGRSSELHHLHHLCQKEQQRTRFLLRLRPRFALLQSHISAPPFVGRRYNTSSPPTRPIRKTKITCAKFWRRPRPRPPPGARGPGRRRQRAGGSSVGMGRRRPAGWLAG